jgi:hypothetical protein
MAILAGVTVDWGTGVIFVAQSDLTFVSGVLWTLNVDDLRLTLKSLEDDEPGQPFLDTHDHGTEKVLAGVTYARSFEVINGYTVEFEDGQYTVSAEGANHNISDVKVANQVSLIVNNSAGLQTVTSGSGLSAAEQAKLDELWRLAGLDIANPMTVTPSARDAGASVSQTITGDGTTTSTVTRNP